jgi:hypothetical protein
MGSDLKHVSSFNFFVLAIFAERHAGTENAI